jgi:hypothetical protein
LTIITYHVFSQPDIRAKPNEELKGANLDCVLWLELEKLPYLSAVIAEGLRFSYGTPSRLARIASHEDLVYRGKADGGQAAGYLIAKGTALGSKSYSSAGSLGEH